MSNYIVNIYPENNTVRVNAKNYKFKRTILGRWLAPCYKCDLIGPCMDLSTGNVDFPFPCVTEVRTDGKSGYFKFSR